VQKKLTKTFTGMILQIRFEVIEYTVFFYTSQLCFFHVKLNMAYQKVHHSFSQGLANRWACCICVCVPAGPGYRWRDYSAMAVIMAGMAFGFYHLYRVCV